MSHRIAEMTVAAVILYRDPSGALADAAGRPAVRRAVESAWAGGATPCRRFIVTLPDGTQRFAFVKFVK